ncbi:MAG: EthD domain-containing protein [Gammaproteobacteria bacterium]|nr:EthD domain-containing protein [Gammaproteobacteria bacterium]
MFKISFFVKRKESVSRDAFRSYWLGRHADQQMQYLREIGVRQYLKCEVLADHPLTLEGMRTYQTGPLRYDFVDHWICNDIKDLKQGAASAAVQRRMAVAYRSEDKYLDLATSNVQMSVDLAQFFPLDGNEVRATEDSPYFKIYYVVRAFPHLNRAQAQLHWNACHGGESRQHIRYSRQKKYIQAHAIDSTFVDRLAATRGYEVDPTLIGHAEGWIDPGSEPQGIAEEEMARVAGMTMDDIDVFADKRRGCVFFAREHYILDEVVVTRSRRPSGKQTMPAFFSAVY